MTSFKSVSAFIAIILFSVGCSSEPPAGKEPVTATARPKLAKAKNAERPAGNEPVAAIAEPKPAEVKDDDKTANKQVPPSTKRRAHSQGKQVPRGRNVWLENLGNKRRVLVDAYVCLREGLLEHLMCRRGTKEHEAILAADMDARDLHTALMLTGIEPGSPVRYEPDYQAPTGPEVTITLQYEENGDVRTIPAQKWIRSIQEKKELDAHWVFVGSQFFPDPFDKSKPPSYAANGGDVICVSNFEDALLDVSIKSSKDNSELAFEAWTERIPPLGTKVTVILEPTLQGKKATK
jgi:hypothetical protein